MAPLFLSNFHKALANYTCT